MATAEPPQGFFFSPKEQFSRSELNPNEKSREFVYGAEVNDRHGVSREIDRIPSPSHRIDTSTVDVKLIPIRRKTKLPKQKRENPVVAILFSEERAKMKGPLSTRTRTSTGKYLEISQI